MVSKKVERIYTIIYVCIMREDKLKHIFYNHEL